MLISTILTNDRKIYEFCKIGRLICQIILKLQYDSMGPMIPEKILILYDLSESKLSCQKDDAIVMISLRTIHIRRADHHHHRY